MDASKRRPTPRVLVVLDAALFSMRLPETLANAGFDVVALYPNARFADAMGELDDPPNLILLPIGFCVEEDVEWIREIRSAKGASDVPILGVAVGGDAASIDFSQLRALGVVGLLDRNTVPEHVVFRVNQVMPAYPERRVRERIPVFLPVVVIAAEEATTEYAVSLSTGGLGIRSSRAIEPNTDVRVQMRCGAPQRRVDLRGRVMHCSPDATAAPSYRLGVVFYPLAEDARVLLEREISRQLTRS